MWLQRHCSPVFAVRANTALPQYWVFSNQMWQPKLKWALGPLYLLCYRKVGILKNVGNVKGWRKGNLKEDKESNSNLSYVMILSNWHLENSYIDVNCDRIKIVPVRSKSVSVRFVCNQRVAHRSGFSLRNTSPKFKQMNSQYSSFIPSDIYYNRIY